MKRYIALTAFILIILTAVLPVAAEDTVITSFDETVAVDEPAESEADIVFNETAAESFIVIDESMSLSEVILSLAERYGISVSEAENMIYEIREIGDRYLSDSDLWSAIVEDMDARPAKWTVIGLISLAVLGLIGLLIKRVLSDAVAMSRLKVAVSNIDLALNGDEEGKEVSIRSMISEKNGHIELLEKENDELKVRTEELTAAVESLKQAIGKLESNSSASLKLSEEAALRILQLLNIALDRKTPIMSGEARKIWYESSQANIKGIYEEGNNGEQGETDDTESQI